MEMGRMKMVIGLLSVMVACASASATVYLQDNFNYTRVPDFNKWHTVQYGTATGTVDGSTAVLNGGSDRVEMRAWDNAVSQVYNFIPKDVHIQFDYARTTLAGTTADGNSLIVFGNINNTGDCVFQIETTPSALYVYTKIGGLGGTVLTLPIALNTWYTIVADSNSDNTVNLRVYDRATFTLLQQVIFSHDPTTTDPLANLLFMARGTGNPATSNITLIDNVVANTMGLIVTCADAIRQGYVLAGDVNKDCFVNFKDVAELAKNWLNCYNPQDITCQHPWQ